MNTTYTITYSIGDVAQDEAQIDGDAANAHVQANQADFDTVVKQAIVTFLKTATPKLPAYTPPPA